MAETQTKTRAEILQAIYKNVKMAEESIITLMPKVQDPDLKRDMTVQLSTFEAFASRTSKLLGREGAKPEEESTLTKMSAKWSAMISTMRDSSSAHLAKLLIEGATMGVTDMMEQLRAIKHTNVGDEVQSLTRDVCAYEERIIEELKAYLR